MFRHWNIYPLEGVRSVAATTMPAQFRRAALQLCDWGRCFDNAGRMTRYFQDLDCRYVTGYARGGTPAPIEHAWIKVGNHHYDPTWELFPELGAEYVPIYELTVEEMVEVMRWRMDDTPPSPLILRRYRAEPGPGPCRRPAG